MLASLDPPFAYTANTVATASAGLCVAVAPSFVTTPWKLYGIAAAIGAAIVVSVGSVRAA